jgi:hypothetical protein
LFKAVEISKGINFTRLARANHLMIKEYQEFNKNMLLEQHLNNIKRGPRLHWRDEEAKGTSMYVIWNW